MVILLEIAVNIDKELVCKMFLNKSCFILMLCLFIFLQSATNFFQCFKILKKYMNYTQDMSPELEFSVGFVYVLLL